MKREVYLKGLNGIRAIAAIAVIIHHVGGGLREFGFSSKFHTDLGGHGVSMFFSLSGFLITYLLLTEIKEFGRVNIKAFYIRRILRIWPLYYFYLILVGLTILFVKQEQLPQQSIYFLLLAGNIPYILGFTYPILHHFWSLGVEEQFYAFWPWVVKKSGNLLRVLIFFTAIFLLAKFVFLYILYYKTEYKWPFLILQVTRFHCMSIGAIGAVLFFNKHKLFLHISFNRVVQVTAWGILVLILFNKFHTASVIDTEIVAVVTVFLILNVCANEKTLVNLDLPVFNFMGKISYGLYVYHPLVLFFVTRWLQPYLSQMGEVYKLIAIYGLVFLATFVIAYLSYTYFEKYFLGLKKSFSMVKSSDTKQTLQAIRISAKQ
jgi:peptidoglycan/LPS O-acetylase OafA/YrhL